MTVAHERRVIDFLVKQSGQEASIAAIHEALSSSDASNPLTSVQIDAAIEKVTTPPRASKSSGANRPPRATKANGKKLIYWGAENYSSVALYEAIQNTFTKKWGPDVLGLKTGEADGVLCPGQPRKGAGDWANPDLVVFAHPRRKTAPHAAREIHCFEIEQQNGFGIQSVYQSYEQEDTLFLEREQLRSKIEGINAKIEALGMEISRAYAVKANILAVIDG